MQRKKVTGAYAGAICPKCGQGMNNKQSITLSEAEELRFKRRYGRSVCDDCKNDLIAENGKQTVCQPLPIISSQCDCNYKPEPKTVQIGKRPNGDLYLIVGEETFEKDQFEFIKNDDGTGVIRFYQ